MKGTKEFYEVVSQFEKDYKNDDSDLYVSCANPLERAPKESNRFYENGSVNQLFQAYVMGYSFNKSISQSDIPALPLTYRDYTIDHAEPASRAKFQYIHKDYDGDGDPRWGTADTIEECKEFIVEQIIGRLENEIDKADTANDEAATQMVYLRKDLAKLNNMLITNHEATIEVLTGFVENAIKTFEYKFESDEGAFNYEQMQAYVDMNAYMLAKVGKTSSPKLRQVLGRMNEMAA